MRIPLISRIRLKYAVLFAAFLFVAQVLEGTTTTFAGLTFLFILISTVAFNAADGFCRPTGFFIFFNATLTCIVGLTFKAFLGEPAQDNLRDPNVTMGAYCLGMVTMALVSALVMRLVPAKGILVGMAASDTMKKAAIGCFILGTVLFALTNTAQESGGLLSAVRQINYFTQMGIILGTFYEVKMSGGQRSSNWVVWAAGMQGFILGGLLGFSKQGFLTGPISWFAAAIAAGHNFSRKQLLGMFSAAVIFQMYLVPYSQVGRNLRAEEPTIASDTKVALSIVTRLPQIRQEFLDTQVDERDSAVHFYAKPEGFMDRMNMLAPDDALIAYTDDGNVEGLDPMGFAFLNIIPHFIYKDKPFYYIGNVYAREIGMIADDNENTGVSFSPVGDAYHEATWFGVLLLTPTVVFLLFVVMNGLSGDVRESPWGLLFCVLVAHEAPEGALGGQIWVATYGAFGIVVVALLTKYVLPVITGVLINTDRTRVERTIAFKPQNRPRPVDGPQQP